MVQSVEKRTVRLIHFHNKRITVSVLANRIQDYICLYLVQYLENDNFAIISLQVEGPRGGDKAVGLTHYIIPKPSDQSQGVEQVNPGHHGLQLQRQERHTEFTLYNCVIHTDH